MRRKPGTSNGTSQLVTYATSTESGKAFSPARNPSSGPRCSRSSCVTLTPAGSSGSDCSRAATTTIGETTVAEEPHDALQHRLGSEGQRSLGNAHAGRPSAAQDNDSCPPPCAAFIPSRASASRVDACCSSFVNATTPGRFARDTGTMKSYCSSCTGRNPSPALRAMISSVIPQSARPCTTAAATAL